MAETPTQTPWGLATWLAAMDEPDSSSRATVTLDQIIQEAKLAIEQPEHQTGDSLLLKTLDLHDEIETVYSQLRAILANPDPNWAGWRHAIEMLIPDSPPRIEQLVKELRAKGMDNLADRLDWLRKAEKDE